MRYINGVGPTGRYGNRLSCDFRVTHATPASFATHIDSRNKYSEIAEQLVESEVDIILGGIGILLYLDSAGSNRDDQLNLLPSFEEKGYSVVLNRMRLKKMLTKLLGCLLQVACCKNRIPSLYRMTLLQMSFNDQGFFLMVEGPQIDWHTPTKLPMWLEKQKTLIMLLVRYLHSLNKIQAILLSLHLIMRRG